MDLAMMTMTIAMTIIKSHQPTLLKSRPINMMRMMGINKVSTVRMTMLPMKLLLICDWCLPRTLHLGEKI
jgi:hypothetical protein